MCILIPLAPPRFHGKIVDDIQRHENFRLPTTLLTLMDLPVDAIDEIARHASNSLCYFGLAHPRLAGIVSRLKRHRIEINHTCENLLRSVALNSKDVRALIFVNCHSESSLILSLILKCPHLTELNTVNSGLTVADLGKSINYLSKLETLTCTCPEGPGDAGEASLPENHSIKSIYIEHGPRAFVYMLKLINSCLKIERLHIVEVPFPRLELDPLWFDIMYQVGALPVDSPISRERWQTLQTVILVKPWRSYYEREIQSIFQNRLAGLDVEIEQFFREKRIVYDRGTFNVRPPTESIVDDESPLLNRRYRVSFGHPVWHYGQPEHLKIEDPSAWSLSGSLPQSLASLTTLVELDLSECHTEDRPHIWDPLFQASAGLESLTLPLCLLTAGACDERRNEVFPFVEALERLKLKKLCCSGLHCKSSSKQEHKCHYFRLLPCLTGLVHLEELTLINPQVGRDFLSRIAIPSISCLRIIKKDYGHLNFPKLKSFLATCRKLRYLKLDFLYLPLEERLLWLRLSRANLKQLCLKSWYSKAVDLRMVRRHLPKLCENLDVLHVHAKKLPNAGEFNSFLTAEIAKINLAKEHNPVWSIPTNSDPDSEMIPNYPGRALCCPQFKSGYELVGWDLH